MMMKKFYYTLALLGLIASGYSKAQDYNTAFKKALYYASVNNLQNAQELFKQLAAQDKNKAIKIRALLNLGTIAERQQNYTQAIILFYD